MYEKAKLMGDTKSVEKILKTTNPYLVKKYGREVKPWNEILWQQNREKIMVDVCFSKFTSSPILREVLLETGNLILVEASPKDRIWGIGLGENYPGIEDPKNWRGLNLLGKSLMTVRDML